MPQSTSSQDRHAANQAAVARMTAVRPAWVAVPTARDALKLADHTLLHAGPPFADPRKPSQPVLSSAVLCCIHEGWAADAEQAEALIGAGRVKLEPAQHYNAVTPLAALISPRSTLVEVADLAHPGRRAWSLLGSGNGPQLRFGSRDPAILPCLAWRDGPLARVLAGVLAAGPIELLPLAVAGVADGDDLHGRTTGASLALAAFLQAHTSDADALAMLAKTPLFFLTLWMAACHLMLDAAARDAGESTLVVAWAGNGQDYGIRLACCPDKWFAAPGHAPQGPRIDPAVRAVTSPVIGDSGAIDAAGFGGQALHSAPEVAAVLAPWVPPRSTEQSAALLVGVHPDFARFNLRMGLDAEAVRATGVVPLANIAMLDEAGRQGLLGRGLFIPDAALFGYALDDKATAEA